MVKSVYDVVLPGTHDTGAYEIPLKNATPAGAPAVLAAIPLRWVLRRTLREFSRTQHGGVLQQLRAGSRYQDFRVALATRADAAKGAFWLVHGAVACVPLLDALRDMRAFTDECAARGEAHKAVVSVCRLLGPGWDAGKRGELRDVVLGTLGEENVYQGDPKGLREVAYDALPAHVVAGVPGVGEFGDGARWGSDIWINTYDLDVKEAGMRKQLEARTKRETRDTMYAVGWTVTPQPKDIALRIVSLGLARPSLEKEAVRFNARFAKFAEEKREKLQDVANVIMFDFITPELVAQVKALND